MVSLHDLMNAHWGHEPQRSAEPLLGADLPTANAPCWKPALRFRERQRGALRAAGNKLAFVEMGSSGRMEPFA